MIPTHKEFYDNAFYLAYYPVQSFLVWRLEKGETPLDFEYMEKDFKGWKQSNMFFDYCDDPCVFAASVIDHYGKLNLISNFDIPDSDPVIMPAQSGTYAVVAHAANEVISWFLGCITRQQRFVNKSALYGMHECFLLPSPSEPVRVRVCSDCGRYFSDEEPDFCVECGSLNNKYVTVLSETLPWPRFCPNSIMNPEDYLTPEQLKELSE